MKGLGRGFESLIPTELIDDEFDPTAVEDKKESKLKDLKIEDIVRDENQPRRDFDQGALEALAASIKEHGVLQPIVVTKEEGKYKIVAGERRWRASKIAGLKKIPAIIRTLDSQNRLELSIIENAQREDLNAIELATAYAKLKTQFNLTAEDIAAKVGKSESSIQNTLRLLNLPDDVKKTMVKEKLPEGVMRPLVSRDEETIKKVLPKIIKEGWTARKVERYFAEHKKKSSTAAIKQSAFRKDEDALTAKYNAVAKINGRSLTFKCKNDTELKNLINTLKGLLILTVFLFSFSVLSFLQLRATSVVAESASAAVTVAAACTMTADVEEAHTDSIPPHTYRADIGTTTFNVLCNDSAGFSIYAVGYSGDQFGGNKLIATVGGELAPTYDIATGTATSGDTSNWAMKLTKVTGTYAPTITGETQGDAENFTAYHAIPSTYTKVATLASATDASTGSSLEATYAAYISGTQPAGTYDGKVKYTLVHPNNETPLQPRPCTASKICYYPNANDAVGVMDTLQSFTLTSNDLPLWPSNFSREGYGFAGWSDKYDWVVNENDENGNGTGVNEGYYIYGPNTSLLSVAAHYSSVSNGLSLYAVWVKAEPNVTMQTFDSTASPYSTKEISTVIALEDERDNDVYAVAKLADGKWWMIENLRLDNTNSDNATGDLAQGYSGVFTGLADPESPWEYDITDENSLYTTDTTSATKNIITGNNYNNARARIPRYNNQNTDSTTRISASYTKSGNIYSYGNYYTWTAAIANTNNYASAGPATSETVGTSICPKGWQLPYGNNTGNGATAGGFYNLLYKANNDVYVNGGRDASKLLRQYPNNFIESGLVGSSSSVRERGTDGYYWSSTPAGGMNSYLLNLHNASVAPGTVSYTWVSGYTVRCVAGS